MKASTINAIMVCLSPTKLPNLFPMDPILDVQLLLPALLLLEDDAFLLPELLLLEAAGAGEEFVGLFRGPWPVLLMSVSFRNVNNAKKSYRIYLRLKPVGKLLYYTSYIFFRWRFLQRLSLFFILTALVNKFLDTLQFDHFTLSNSAWCEIQSVKSNIEVVIEVKKWNGTFHSFIPCHVEFIFYAIESQLKEKR